MENKKQLKFYHGIIGAILVFLLIGFVVPMFSGLLGKTSSSVGELLFVVIAAALTVLFGADVKDILPFKLPPIKQFFASVGMMVGTVMLGGAVNVVTAKLIPRFSERGDAINSLANSMSPAFAIITIALLPALCEEIFFRGFLQRSFASKRPWITVVAVALVFGIFHFDLYALASTTLMGALFAFIVYKTESLLLPMMLHFANNAIAVASAYSASGSDTSAGADILTSMSNVQTAGYVLFYLGIAIALLYFSTMWFLSKKLKAKVAVTVGVTAALLFTAGYGTIIVSSIEFSASELVKFSLDETNEESCEVELESGFYSFSVSSSSSSEVTVYIVDESGKEIAKSQTMASVSLIYQGEFSGKYTVKVVGAQGGKGEVMAQIFVMRNKNVVVTDVGESVTG